MESKKWLWIVVAGLAIVAAYQLVKLTSGDSAEPLSPQVQQIVEPDRQLVQTASFGELPVMPEERKPPVIEPAEVEEPEQTREAASEGSKPDLEEPEPDAADREETAEVATLPDPPLPAVAQPVIEPISQSPAVDAPVRFPSRGLVRGVVYSAEDGSALIGGTIVRTGGTVDGVRILRIHAGGVDFEKNGHRWTQKVSETPDPLWW